MLESVEIENLAVIKSARVTFGKNLNVFTGETGAGKSVLLHGLQAVLGFKTNREMVRNGSQKAIITAVFSDLSDEVIAFLKENDLINDEDTEIIIKREIFANGKTSSKVNFHNVTISLLKELGSMLVDVHGQHDNQILLNNDSHLRIIDNFGNNDDLFLSYQSSFKELQRTAKQISKLKNEAAVKARRLKYYNEVIEDLSELKIEDADEEERLEQEFQIAQNSEDLINVCKFSKNSLDGSEYCANAYIYNIMEEVRKYTDISPEIAELYKRLESARIDLKDISEEFDRIADDSYIDEERYAYIDDRLGKFYKLKKKYGCEFKDLLTLQKTAENEINNYHSDTFEIDNLNEKKEKLLVEVSEKAKILSQKRRDTAKKFSAGVTEQLKFLNMENVRIDVNQTVGKLTQSGMDTMEILISTNKGEPLKPIAKIASGGELSRIMLAIKSVVVDRDNIPTMIFDEIDTGVSGMAAQKIGLKLHEIGKNHQVICVTHLSQIAVMADTHILIEKHVIGDRTETNIKTLDYDGKVREIARIMGGANPDKQIINAAKSALNDA